MSTLIAGYFVGEFGWNLMRWQGIIRHMAQNYDKVIIGCEKSMTFLFEDFATDFVFLHIDIKSRNMWMANQMVYEMPHSENDNYIKPCREICLSNGNFHQNFIKWGNKNEEYQYDLLIHARSTNNFNTGYRNWAYDNWIELLVELWDCHLNIASIGNNEDAMHIPGTDDLRGIPLKNLADVMASSKLMVSPSSGPGHFASLCGCKHLIWSDEKDQGLYNNKFRWLEDWNPFNTECYFIPEWQPSVERVQKGIEICLSE